MATGSGSCVATATCSSRGEGRLEKPRCSLATWAKWVKGLNCLLIMMPFVHTHTHEYYRSAVGSVASGKNCQARTLGCDASMKNCSLDARLSLTGRRWEWPTVPPDPEKPRSDG